jgi:hypothetical protein
MRLRSVHFDGPVYGSGKTSPARGAHPFRTRGCSGIGVDGVGYGHQNLVGCPLPSGPLRRRKAGAGSEQEKYCAGDVVRERSDPAGLLGVGAGTFWNSDIFDPDVEVQRSGIPNAFYRDRQVVGAEGEGVQDSRLAICVVTKRAIARTLGLLGISAPSGCRARRSYLHPYEPSLATPQSSLTPIVST